MTTDGNYFPARWGKSLRVMTAVFLLICAAIPLIVFTSAHLVAGIAMAIFIWAIVLGALFFGVRGYLVTSTSLIILRLGWETRFSLEDVISCRADSEAMTGSIRLAGNGGLFAFTGLYHNTRLGNYRAFATDPENAVVIEFTERTIVVTPENPRGFVEALLTARAELK